VGLTGCVGQVSRSGPGDGGSLDAGGDPGATDARPGDPPGSDASPSNDGKVAVWLGTGAYDPSADGRIDPLVLDGDDVVPGASVSAGSLPSWMTLSAAGDRLYAVDENRSQVRTFAVARVTGALSDLGAVPSGGTGPVHVGIDGTGRWLLVAHYTSGEVSVLAIESDGTLGSTPTDVERTGRNTHQVVIDRSNRHVFVPCVGDNHVAQLVFDADEGTLAPNTPAAVVAESGAGPRHLVLHPSMSLAYVVNELNSTVTAYSVSENSGTLQRGGSLSALPDDFEGANTGAEILIGSDGGFLYTSNRGHDSVAVFRVGDDGALSAVAHTPTGGATPRSIALTPDGDRLLVANQASNTVISLRVDRSEGTLSSPRPVAQTSANVFFVGVSSTIAP
jgi:6-phosphogluconolactonase